MKKWRLIACVVITAGLAAWAILFWLEKYYFGVGPNYDLIEDGLFLGGAVSKPPPGTEAVLNLCETEDPYRADVNLWKSIPDSAPAPELDWLREAVKFVDDQRQAGRTTYVHCRNGSSRGGMVVTAYIMFKNGWTRDKALEFVKSQRPVVRPNPAFMERLLDWEQALSPK